MTPLKQRSLNQLPKKDCQVALAFTHKLQQHFTQQVISVILFGSRARGQANPNSDMDLLVVLSSIDPNVRKEVHYLTADVWLEYGVFLSTLVWSQDYRRKVEELQTSLYQEIYRDGIDLLTRAASTA